MKLAVHVFLLFICCIQASSSEERGADTNANNLYQIALLRAAPGQLPSLIEQVKAHKKALNGELLIMRHSQGDHWDLMLLWPTTAQLPKQESYGDWVDFQHNFIASSSTNWKALSTNSLAANLFHIEMFQAAKGSYSKLLEQRKMENNYLVATQRKANYIFLTEFGSDVDMFTLGIYADMQAFATEPNLPDEAFEKAAVDAGFKARSEIGFYLREFLVGHQDTLATQVK